MRKLLLIAFAIYKSGEPFTADCPVIDRCAKKDEAEERHKGAHQKEATNANEHVKRGGTVPSANSSCSGQVETDKCVMDKSPKPLDRQYSI
jgi:hypothetical protein